MPKFVLLWTDAAIWLLALAALGYALMVRRRENLRAAWLRVFADGPAFASAVVLALGLAITLADSLHFRLPLPPTPATGGHVAYDVRTQSLLDALLRRQIQGRETTYSRPLACESYTRETVQRAGRSERVAPRLSFGCAHLSDPPSQWGADVAARAVLGLLGGLVATLVATALVVGTVSAQQGIAWGAAVRCVWRGQAKLPWRAALATFAALALAIGAVAALMRHYHVFGTDVTGNDVLVQALKSVRTAFVIGSLATIGTLPLAVGLGIAAGYLRGWVDEAVQYLYTLLSSIPNILLIAACVLMVQVFLDTHPDLFDTALERADLKLFLLCAVLGLTGWAGLCRLLRAETLKLRELEYVQAAQAFGVGPARIMRRHVFPNVTHLMLIVTVLEFSSLILYEAVLSYVGVGVDPAMNSFGGMINFARNEMSRDPVVWWPFAAAFGFMVVLVLAANLFADGVRTAFSPK